MVSYKGGPIGLLLGLFCVVSTSVVSRAAPRGLGPGSYFIRLSGLQDKPVWTVYIPIEPISCIGALLAPAPLWLATLEVLPVSS